MSLDQSTQSHSMGLHPIRPSVNQDPLKREAMPMPTLPSLSSSMNQAKRKRDSPSKSMKPNKIVKKSQSTPMMHPGSMSPGSGDDKKRNKLGYHRTSVACGHCRRRKIRCMMPDDDPSGRCSNCIRLKKECNFYPVDQNMVGMGPHPANRAVSMPKGGLRSHSPTPMYLPSSYGDFPHYGQGHNSFSVPPPETTGLGLFNTSTAPSYHEPSVTYTAPYDGPSTTWDSSPYATLPPISAPHESPYGYQNGINGRQFESSLSVSPAPPPYTRPSSTFRPSPFPDSAYGSVASGRTPSNEIGWAPPHQQSAGAAASTYRGSYSPQPPLDDRRSASIPNPPSLVMSSDNASTPTLSEPTTVAPMSAPTASSSYWQNPWTPIPGAPSDVMEPSKAFSAAEPFENGSWFPETINGY